MAYFFRSAASWIAQRDPLWRLLEGSLVKFAHHALRERRRVEASRYACRYVHPEENVPSATPVRAYGGRQAALAESFPTLTIAHGPFAGLAYPAGKAYGSAIFPKLLGCYERELHDVVAKIIATPYCHVIDVGCAEGYYANGFALKMPQTSVHAYDINPLATTFCANMAKHNGLASRVHTGAYCTAETLVQFPFSGRSIVLADCEGYEKHLFTPEACLALASHDVLIEVHDFIDVEISGQLRRNFANTHDLQVIESTDDLKKIHQYHYAELDGYDLQARLDLVGEHRPAIMQWFFLTPKSNLQPPIL